MILLTLRAFRYARSPVDSWNALFTFEYLVNDEDARRLYLGEDFRM